MWSPNRLGTVALALLLVTSGCLGAITGGGGGDDGDSGRADEIQQQSVAAMQEVDQYRMTMEMAATNGDRSVTVQMDGAFDRDAKQARMDMTLRGQDAVVYVDGSTMYVESGGRWQTRQVPADQTWGSGSSLEQQREMLESADPTLVGNATVDGEAVYVLRMEPSAEQARTLMQSGGQSLGMADIEDVTIEQYVDKDTHRVRKTTIQMTVSQGDQTVSVEGTVTFSGFGDPVDVTVPDEATGGSSAALALP